MSMVAVARMLDWLAVVSTTHDGAVPSWVNPAHRGYPYPEAAGLLLTSLAQARPQARELSQPARWLAARVDADGLVGRDDHRYAFDTAMALTGLLCAQRAGIELDRAVLARMADALLDAVVSRTAMRPTDPTNRRWSARWSCHQLKLCWVLMASSELVGEARTRPAITVLEQLLVLEHEGRFQLAPDDARSYVHASCYALEGVLALRRLGREQQRATAILRRGCEWLASIQAEDGSLPSWCGPAIDEPIQRPSDVIAQAVRLWAAVDRSGHAREIERGCAALLRRQSESGGVAYLEDGRDINTWCTAFAAQALRWAEAGQPADEWLV
jgi:hypothetical protein